jgi:hypothetical protein
MRLIIEEYRNKLADIPQHGFPTTVLPEYERTTLLEWPNSGYTSRQEWKTRMRQMSGFEGFTEDGKARFDRGRSYGIHSYQLVWIQD